MKTKTANLWSKLIISKIEKRLEDLKYFEDCNLAPIQAMREIERLNNLKSVVENTNKGSFVYQKDKVEKTIKILNNRFTNWLNATGQREDKPGVRSVYNAESGLNHLRRQRRNIYYILSLEDAKNENHNTPTN